LCLILRHWGKNTDGGVLGQSAEEDVKI
jgi:hypothetical protein